MRKRMWKNRKKYWMEPGPVGVDEWKEPSAVPMWYLVMTRRTIWSQPCNYPFQKTEIVSFPPLTATITTAKGGTLSSIENNATLSSLILWNLYKQCSVNHNSEKWTLLKQLPAAVWLHYQFDNTIPSIKFNLFKLSKYCGLLIKNVKTWTLLEKLVWTFP